MTICGWGLIGKEAQIYEPCVVLKPERIRVGERFRLDAFCKLEGGQGVEIGDHVHFGSGSMINTGGGQLLFGSHSGTSVNVVIATGNPDLEYLHVTPCYPPELVHPIRARTVIGEYVVIFAGAVITPGVTIGDGAVIGANAVVTKDVPAWEVWAGNPAKFIKRRILKHCGPPWE